MANESILDLTFISPQLANKIDNWAIVPDIGLDHYRISFSIQISLDSANLVINPAQLAGYNIELADWPLFSSTLQLEA